MVGDIKRIAGKEYVVTNSKGTMMLLPKVKWYKSLEIYFIQRIKNLRFEEVAKLYKKYEVKNGNGD